MDSLDPRAEQMGASTPGRHIVLPSSYAGSPRNMLGHYQDSMAMVSQLGAPGKIDCSHRFSSSNGVPFRCIRHNDNQPERSRHKGESAQRRTIPLHATPGHQGGVPQVQATHGRGRERRYSLIRFTVLHNGCLKEYSAPSSAGLTSSNSKSVAYPIYMRC
jgi:hypothetical protein